MTLRLLFFSLRFHCLPSLPVCRPTCTFFSCFPSLLPPFSWLSEFPLLCPSLVTPQPLLFFPFGSCNTRWYFGEINLSKPHLPCRASSRLHEGKVCLWDARRSSLLPRLFFLILLFPAHLVFCSPFIRNSQVNLLMWGTDAKSYPGFCFSVLILWFPSLSPLPQRKRSV